MVNIVLYFYTHITFLYHDAPKNNINLKQKKKINTTTIKTPPQKWKLQIKESD